MDRLHSLRKIRPQLRGTNFCTCSARCAPSFVRQPNGPECKHIVRNTPKHHFRVQWGGSGAFVAKNSDATSWHKLLHCLARFAPNSVRQPNSPKCAQIKRNVPNISLRSNGVDRVRSLRKIPTRLHCTNFYTSLACFAPSFVRQPNGPKCTQVVRFALKRQLRVQWGASCVFFAKNSDATSWHELLH